MSTPDRTVESGTETLLEVADLSLHFPLPTAPLTRLTGRKPEVVHALDGIDLRITRGEALGLVGESGSGKTTLARCIAGLYEPTAGRMIFDRQPLPERRSPALHRRIQMVFQDPYSSLDPRMTVRQTVSEVLRVHRVVPRGQVRTRCDELLDLVGLGRSLLDAYPRQLSGGQRQRVSIARALAAEPELLLADEPVSALDVSVQAKILNLLQDLRRQLNLTLLLITHNMAVAEHICNRIAVMYLGRIVETGGASTMFRDPRHPYTHGLLQAVPQLLADRVVEVAAVSGDPPSPINLPTGCRFHPRCPRAEAICTQTDPALIPGPNNPSHLAACHFAWLTAASEPGAAQDQPEEKT